MVEVKYFILLVILGVSCGIYGFFCDFCVKIILDIVFEFCEKNLNCCLLEIYFIDKDD